MATSNNTRYTMTFDSDGANGLGVIGSSLNPITSDLIIVYHFADFTSTATIREVNPLGESEPVSARVTVRSFTINYANTSLTLAVAGSTSSGQLSFYGQHQGVFDQEEWRTRNNGPDSGRDSTGREVDLRFITISKSINTLPDEYLAGYRAQPDRRTSTSISWTVTLDLTTSVGNRTTSLTFSNITQTVLNDWSRFRSLIRNPFVGDGTSERTGATTYAAQTLTLLSGATFSVANTTSAGSGATVTVAFSRPHGVLAGSIIEVSITSTGTNHALARGQFFADTVPNNTSLTYTLTSVGTVSTTTSLLGTVAYYK
jgi:hypothetical protein